MTTALDLLREHVEIPPGFRLRVLSCAWCPGGDRLELGEYRMTWLAPVNRYTGKRDRITETFPEPPAKVIRDWLERHSACR
jgi:hypothetical protein